MTALLLGWIGWTLQVNDTREMDIVRATEVKRRNIEAMGHKPTAQELAALGAMERHAADARVLVNSLNEILVILTEPSQVRLQREYAELRDEAQSVIDAYVPSRASAAQMLAAVQNYVEKAPEVAKRLAAVRTTVSERRLKFYADGLLAPTYEIEVVGTPSGDGTLGFSAEGVQLRVSGQRLRVARPVIVCAPMDSRLVSAYGMLRQRDTTILEFGPDLLKYHQKDPLRVFTWRKTAESFTWKENWRGEQTSGATYSGEDGPPRRTASHCAFEVAHPVVDVNFVVEGKTTWSLESQFKDEPPRVQTETHAVAGTIRLRIFCV